MDTAIRDILQRSQRILAICHVNPDGDALGSLLGFGWALKEMGKETALACADPVPPFYQYLPGHEEIVQQPVGEFDLVVSLDCSDAQRMGDSYRDEYRRLPLLNVDHHVTNLRFGTFNLVDLEAASTAEIIFLMLDELALPLDPPIAQCLLTGIVTDTRGFRTASCTPRVLSIANRLMAAGASLPEIVSRTLDRRPLAAIRLWAQALPGAQLRGRVLWTEVTEAMRAATGLATVDDSGLVNFLLTAEEADVAVVFSEKNGGQEVEVGFRARPGWDVAQVALALGGGGHMLASGVTVRGTLPEVRERVLALLDESLAAQERAHRIT
ncbi:MAG: bifunctional oligoribonuclease/PAP phosphatase NrnA [Anaerolineae bacterium]|nr:bifunctional oligoribonuclease/PAP phosphatase NrnA [Anaerolineae bacterium]